MPLSSSFGVVVVVGGTGVDTGVVIVVSIVVHIVQTSAEDWPGVTIKKEGLFL